MAKLTGNFQFEGSIEGITVYKRWDIEKPIVRSKGHPSREKMKTHENFDRTRRNNQEFGGRSKCTSYFHKIFRRLNLVCDSGYTGALNSLLIEAQKKDTVSQYGRRSVLLSQSKEIVEGFNLNKRNPLETILNNGINCSYSPQDKSVAVNLPDFVPGRNFHPIGTFPVYRILLSAGLVPDFYFDDTKGWHHNQPFPVIHQVEHYSPWRSVYETTVAETINLSIDQPVQGDDYTVIVAAGISFGLIRGLNEYNAVNGAGCGKVVGVF